MDSSLPESRERKEKKVDAVDCRKEVVNKILLWAAAKGIDIEECRYDIDLILNGVEIIKRCTEIAQDLPCHPIVVNCFRAVLVVCHAQIYFQSIGF